VSFPIPGCLAVLVQRRGLHSSLAVFHCWFAHNLFAASAGADMYAHPRALLSLGGTAQYSHCLLVEVVEKRISMVLLLLLLLLLLPPLLPLAMLLVLAMNTYKAMLEKSGGSKAVGTWKPVAAEMHASDRQPSPCSAASSLL